MQERHNLFIEDIQETQCPSMAEKVDKIMDIDERIDITQVQQQITAPLQSPDLLRYYYMTQLLRARTNSSRGSQDFEDYMFKEDATTTYPAE
ncbi:uncharacterized protein ATC70_009082 [Mucor velutinosus]|uniref:Uncharacterized protein n=1 Tax=Mucor velutinosus TaxID=708070 RepID=A0AAN7I2C1_9FUNG|nr:hypothetical protein ATC70_009082 [Mucor velutinosus]